PRGTRRPRVGPRGRRSQRRAGFAPATARPTGGVGGKSSSGVASWQPPERRKGSDGGRRRGRGGDASSLPNGDTDPTARESPRAAPPTTSTPPPGATRSNGHAAHQRTAGHLDPRPGALYSEKAVVVAPGPKYRGEVFAPGRQGLRVQRD